MKRGKKDTRKGKVDTGIKGCKGQKETIAQRDHV
jgi:hypothetical protein